MTLPEGVQPSGPTEDPAAITEPEPEATASSEPAVEEPVLVDDPETVVDESASDAELRAWAKENGIEDVPASGRLSAAWREQILAAMAAALDPKEEASAEASSVESSTSTETSSTDQESPDSTDEETPATEAEPVAPEFETGEYRSVFKAPNTFVTSQAFTA